MTFLKMLSTLSKMLTVIEKANRVSRIKHRNDDEDVKHAMNRLRLAEMRRDAGLLPHTNRPILDSRELLQYEDRIVKRTTKGR